MNYDTWKTTPPDDDPEGEYQDDEQSCQDCGAPVDEDCADDCDCTRCNNRRERAYTQRVTGV